jgi:hypothetical protein
MLYVHGFANGTSFLVISSKNYLGVASWLCWGLATNFFEGFQRLDLVMLLCLIFKIICCSYPIILVIKLRFLYFHGGWFYILLNWKLCSIKALLLTPLLCDKCTIGFISEMILNT